MQRSRSCTRSTMWINLKVLFWEHALFLWKFLTRGTQIASVAPSSRRLAATAAEQIGSDSAIVLELGAGTGAITREILRVAPQNCRIIAVENDPDFSRELRTRFQSDARLTILETDATDLENVAAMAHIDHADHIVSGLPTPSFPPPKLDRLTKGIASLLSSEGTFSQITEIPFVYLPFYKKLFASVHFRFVARNIPPGGVYTCRHPL